VNTLNQKPERIDAELLSAVQYVVESANFKLHSELQLENAAEVLENIKYETAHTSWLDRLPSSGAGITVATLHPECESVTGKLLLANASIVALTTDTYRFLFCNSHIVWLAGLQSKSVAEKQNPLDSFALQLLLQDLLDQQNLDTWFINGGKTLTGRLVRIFSDSVELTIGEKPITLLIDQVVAVRSHI
jgi:hypothetical protein